MTTRAAFASALIALAAAPSAMGDPSNKTTDRDPDPDWWKSAVFYEIFVRSFADSTEGPLAADGVGDIRGLISRLDYLRTDNRFDHNDLGINAIWLMPIAQSPSYHGYDVTDYTRIDDEYGTNDDFRALVDACHARGIRVIVDLVLNHSSHQHPWFVEATSSPDSPKRGWYTWSNEDPGYRGPWGQQVWHRTSRDNGAPFYYGCFSSQMPDLNVQNEDLTRELKDIARFWIEDMNVDGFRLDAIKHLIEHGEQQENTQDTIDWLEDFHAYCESLDPEFFAVGEVWSSTDEVKRYIPNAVDTAFEFDLSGAIITAINEGNAAPIEDRLAIINSAYDTPVATFLTNHDQARLMTQLHESEPAARAAASILLTIPGVPFIYYGEEIGHTGGKPDPNIRTPMQWDARGEQFSAADPWHAPQPNADTVNVETMRYGNTLLKHYIRMIELRLNTPALARGDLSLLKSDHDGILAFERETPDQRLLVVTNTTDDWAYNFLITLTRPGITTHEIQNLAAPSGATLRDKPEIWLGGAIGPYQTVIFEIQEPNKLPEIRIHND
jgi:glycosidase